MKASLSVRRRLGVPPHVRVCRVDDQVIMLDLRRNRYFGVASRPAAGLADIVAGWPRPVRGVREDEGPTDVTKVADSLVARGLLTDCCVDDPPTDSIEEACASVNGEDAHSLSIDSKRRTWHILRSAASAATSLRFRTLLSIARSVRDRRPRLEEQMAPTTAEAMRKAVTAYHSMRPLLFTAKDRCMYDSLTLINALACEDIYPHWVIGVSARPFAAHAWVQSGSCVVNDQHERVRRFTPILVA